MNPPSIQFHGQSFQLLPDRALHWPAARTLIIADLHLGKAHTFRSRGLPVPAGTTERDLARLSALIEAFRPERLLVLGDLVHAREAESTLDLLCEWRAGWVALEVAVAPGNHDRHVQAESLSRACRLLESPYVEAGIEWSHHPQEKPARPIVAGHVHPTVRLNDFDGSGVRVPCFVVDPNQIILPSFGTFTGGCAMPRAEGRRLFAAAAGRVVETR